MTYDGTLSDATIWLRVNADRTNELEVKTGTLLYLAGNRIKSDITIFSIGTNDGWTIKTNNVFDAEKSAENYITMIDMAISKSNTEAFIVCSPYGGVALNVAGVEGLKVLEKALLKKYGCRYFNWREYLVNYGLSDAGITPTDEDANAIEKGECPPSLLADGLHPNDNGHKVIGDKLYEIMNNIGYFN